MKSAARCNKAMEWLSAETRSKARERPGEARPGHREELKELSCEGKAKRRREMQWNSVDPRCVAMEVLGQERHGEGKEPSCQD